MAEDGASSVVRAEETWPAADVASNPLRQAEQVWRACVTKSSRTKKEYNVMTRCPELAGALLALELYEETRERSIKDDNDDGPQPSAPLPPDVAMSIWRLLNVCLKCKTAGSVPAVCITAVEYDTTGEIQLRVQAEERLCRRCVEPELLRRSASGSDCKILKGSAINGDDPESALVLILAQAQLLILKGPASRVTDLILRTAARHIHDGDFRLGGVRPAPMSSGLHLEGRQSGFDQAHLVVDTLRPDLLITAGIKRLSITQFLMDPDVVAALSSVPLTHVTLDVGAGKLSDLSFVAWHEDTPLAESLQSLTLIDSADRRLTLERLCPSLHHLRHLHLEKFEARAVLANVATLKSLESLTLDGGSVDDADLALLMPIAPKLTRLTIRRGRMGLSRHCAVWGAMTRLEYLRLNSGDGYTVDQTLAQHILVTLPSLRMVSLGACGTDWLQPGLATLCTRTLEYVEVRKDRWATRRDVKKFPVQTCIIGFDGTVEMGTRRYF